MCLANLGKKRLLCLSFFFPASFCLRPVGMRKRRLPPAKRFGFPAVLSRTGTARFTSTSCFSRPCAKKRVFDALFFSPRSIGPTKEKKRGGSTVGARRVGFLSPCPLPQSVGFTTALWHKKDDAAIVFFSLSVSLAVGGIKRDGIGRPVHVRGGFQSGCSWSHAINAGSARRRSAFLKHTVRHSGHPCAYAQRTMSYRFFSTRRTHTFHLHGQPFAIAHSITSR